MKRSQLNVQTFFMILLFSAFFTSCSNRLDDTNFRKYLSQDTKIKGKAGVLITALGQPEKYDYRFFDNYMNLIFKAVFPKLLQFIIMRDSGTVLRDPDNLFASEEFTPKTLMDCYGNTSNKDSVPYTRLPVKWVKPRKKGGAGHFLLKEKNGLVDIVEKPAIKIVSSYYARMPGNTIPYVRQHEAVFDGVRSLLDEQFPGVPVRTAWAMYPETVEQALEELLKEKVETIVVCDLFPVFSNLEEFNSLFVEIEHMVNGRAKLIFTPSIGAFATFRKAFVTMARDEIAKLPAGTKNLMVLTRHGFPEMPSETYHQLAPAYYSNLQKEVKKALAGTDTRVVFADTEFSGDDDDPDNKRLSSAEALENGLKEKYDNIIFVLVDFLSENTDTVYCAREEALEPIEFKYGSSVPYNDFSRPFRTELKQGSTNITVAGTPVGSRYQPLVSRGIFDAIATVLKGKKWPEMVLKQEQEGEAVL